jgi:nicotinate-nucleotide pyrophosphorylase (carboxylating)
VRRSAGATGPGALAHPEVARLVAAALREDLGRGDVTTAATVPPDARGEGQIVARAECVVAGLPLLDLVFAELGEVRVDRRVADGATVRAGAVLARLDGDLTAILSGERLALNLLQRLSGVATLTQRFVAAVAGTKAQILDTRKTTPGLRLLEKYAVRMGGGRNHRFGLDDGILIKDNHIAVCGSVREAVTRALVHAPHGLRVEVECDRLDQVREALAAGAHAVLLDNMGPKEVARAVKLVAGRAVVEVSGGVDLTTVRFFAETGADLISVGKLTHSAPAVDIALDFAPPRAARAKHLGAAPKSARRGRSGTVRAASAKSRRRRASAPLAAARRRERGSA